MSAEQHEKHLRFYEHWLLQWLIKSPRINRIVVEVNLPTPRDQSLDYTAYLEEMYRAPSSREERQG